MTNDSGEQPEEIESLNQFINENHRLFTVIGVFGALAVYLAEIGYTGNVVYKQGIAGALILFLVTSLVGVRNALENLRTASNNDDIVNMLIYSTILYSLGALSFTILVTMAEKFPEGTGTTLSGAIAYVLAVLYMSYVLFSEKLTDFKSHTKIGIIAPYLPIIGLLILFVLFSISWIFGDLPDLFGGSPAEQLGYIIGTVISHGMITAFLYLSLRTLDWTLNETRRMVQ